MAGDTGKYGRHERRASSPIPPPELSGSGSKGLISALNRRAPLRRPFKRVDYTYVSQH